jgi:hypothetical protein
MLERPLASEKESCEALDVNNTFYSLIQLASTILNLPAT